MDSDKVIHEANTEGKSHGDSSHTQISDVKMTDIAGLKDILEDSVSAKTGTVQSNNTNISKTKSSLTAQKNPYFSGNNYDVEDLDVEDEDVDDAFLVAEKEINGNRLQSGTHISTGNIDPQYKHRFSSQNEGIDFVEEGN
jgi:hypothetical protein